MDQDKEDSALIIDRNMQAAQYTFSQDTAVFQAWHVFIIINCLYTSCIYPYYNMASFPDVDTPSFWILAVSELFFGIEIILNFFKQEIDEEGKSK